MIGPAPPAAPPHGRRYIPAEIASWQALTRSLYSSEYNDHEPLPHDLLDQPLAGAAGAAALVLERRPGARARIGPGAPAGACGQPAGAAHAHLRPRRHAALLDHRHLSVDGRAAADPGEARRR